MTTSSKPSREEAKEAVRVLLRFIGDDPNREGLLQTPDRVVDSYGEMFCGYSQDIATVLDAKFYDTGSFKDFVLLRSIRFTSFCEHYMDMIGGEVEVCNSSLFPGDLGQVKWSGTVMNARLDKTEQNSAAIGDKLFITAIHGNILICSKTRKHKFDGD